MLDWIGSMVEYWETQDELKEQRKREGELQIKIDQARAVHA